MFYKADYFVLEDAMLEDYYMEVEDGVIVGFSKMNRATMSIWERLWLLVLSIPTSMVTTARIL